MRQDHAQSRASKHAYLSFLPPQNNLYKEWQKKGSSNRQERYAKYCHDAVIDCTDILRQDPNINLYKLYVFFAGVRRIIEISLNERDIQNIRDFGVFREKSIEWYRTPVVKNEKLDAEYSKILPKLSKSLTITQPRSQIPGLHNVFESAKKYKAKATQILSQSEPKADRNLARNLTSMLSTLESSNADAFDSMPRQQLVTRLTINDGEEIILTRAINIVSNLDKTIYHAASWRPAPRYEGMIALFHCLGKDMPKVFVKADEILRKITSYNYSNKQSELFEDIGSFAHLIANMCPMLRGSASSSDMIIKTLLNFHNLPLLPYKEDVCWDIDAMTSNARDYSQNFSQMFINSDETDIGALDEMNFDYEKLDYRLPKFSAFKDTAFSQEDIKQDSLLRGCKYKEVINYDDLQIVSKYLYNAINITAGNYQMNDSNKRDREPAEDSESMIEQVNSKRHKAMPSI